MPPVTTVPYDTVEYVLNLARSIANDAALSIQGTLLADTTPYTFQFVNSCYRALQEELTDFGVETLTDFADFYQIPPLTVNPDPSYYASISFTGYNNGVANFLNPALPPDLIIPLRLWERQSGVNAQFVPMAPTNDGLPSISQSYQFRLWSWESDEIRLIGATQTNDMRVRYLKALPDILDGDSQILILRSSNALAYMIVATFAEARGSPLADGLRTQADNFMGKMANRTARKRQRGSHRRAPYGGGGGWGWQDQWGTFGS